MARLAEEMVQDEDVAMEETQLDTGHSSAVKVSPEESADESTDAEEPSMVVSRSRRSNAGRNLSKLIAQAGAEDEEQDETVREIFQEIVGDDEFSEEDGDDAGDFNMDSSSSDEDEDDGDEEKGEKELQKAERHGKTGKRKTMQQMYKPRPPKKPRLQASSSVVTSQEAAADGAAKLRKKSERVSWIPTVDEGPTRASKRTLAVENKARVHERLKEKEAHRLHTLAVMRAADNRKETDKRKELTQADRLEEAAQVEAHNRRTLSHWAESERIREEERKERLAALKNRTIEGPYIRFWSGQSVWAGEKMQHIGRGAKVEEVEAEVNERAQATYKNKLQKYHKEQEERERAAAQTVAIQDGSVTPLASGPPRHAQPTLSIIPTDPSTDMMDTSKPAVFSEQNFQPSTVGNHLLDGIEQWASSAGQKQSSPSAPEPVQALPPQNTTISHVLPVISISQHHIIQPPISTQTPQQQQQQPPAPALPPQPPSYLYAEMATRTLIVIENISSQSERPTPSTTDSPAPTEKISKKDRERDTLTRALLPHTAHTGIAGNVVRGKYASIKQAVLCEITGKAARYRDPMTGLAYSDSYSYKCIQRLVYGGCQWSGLLGAFVGPAMDAARPANGVPDIFIRMTEEQRV